MTLDRHLLYLAFQLYTGFVSVNYYTTRKQCDSSSIFTTVDGPELYSSDMATVETRIKETQDFRALSIAIVLLMTITVAVGELRARSPYYKGKGYLPGPAVVVLPSLILIGTVAVRFRHMGLFGCASGDSHCCSNFDVSVDMPMNTPVSGCNATYVDLYDNRNFCVIPQWYNTRQCQTGLIQTVNLPLYQAYGCSSKYTAEAYWLNRMLSFVELSFAILSIYIKLP